MKPLVIVMALGFLSLTSCVPYAIYKTLQPPATATVLDSHGRAVADAEVTLIANAYPYGVEKSRVTQKTGSDGVARFTAAREWRTESLMIHGADVFF